MATEKAISDEQREQYGRRLRDARDRLLADVDDLVESVRHGLNPESNLSKVPVHLADEASDQVDADINLIETERDTLEQIQAALHRLDEGTFGRCVECGCTIPAARLDVIPHTPHCISCAKKQSAEGLPR